MASIHSLGRRLVTSAMPSITLGKKSTSHTFKSLDEVPPELRPRVQELLAKAKATGKAETVEFKILDSNGTVKTYRSLEEMPPKFAANSKP